MKDMATRVAEKRLKIKELDDSFAAVKSVGGKKYTIYFVDPS